jgi:archaellum component FlaG (FlaF/FlaG flagellin family)
MKKIIITFAVTAAFVSCDVKRKDKISDSVNIDSTKMANAMNQPTTVQLIDSTFDFGTITEGEKVEYSYRFKNTGSTPLMIVSASASCGCTVPEKPEKPILPGETSYIKVVFNSQGKVGQNHKDITVIANTSPAFPTLKLSGEVTAKK